MRKTLVKSEDFSKFQFHIKAVTNRNMTVTMVTIVIGVLFPLTFL